MTTATGRPAGNAGRLSCVYTRPRFFRLDRPPTVPGHDSDPDVTITRVFTFDAAHFNEAYGGKCGNIHGHTYRLLVEVGGARHASGQLEGMVLDGAAIKTIVQEYVVDPMDHATLCHGHAQVAKLPEGTKVHPIGEVTTVENVAVWITQRLQDAGLPVVHVRLHETPKMWADVYPTPQRDGSPETRREHPKGPYYDPYDSAPE